MKQIFIVLSLAILSSCNTQASENDKSEIEITEDLINDHRMTTTNR